MASLWTHALLLAAASLPCPGLTPPARVSPPQQQQPLGLGHNSSDAGPLLDLPAALRVFSVDYHHVQAPFEIVLWIMLASLAKLGKPCGFNRVSGTMQTRQHRKD